MSGLGVPITRLGNYESVHIRAQGRRQGHFCLLSRAEQGPVACYWILPATNTSHSALCSLGDCSLGGEWYGEGG